ncbi:unnamed protein product [Vitrella brassicaformis CCMP3155]|uniref:UTP-monosaccharide-1-phosphate uridylyltransferase n=2 Tax=Vitrella brassicaformis TaxID=1169539 RepID=A0A0G4ELU9_VITBC|nr:unnamed protein product [Vitrella brassicaformis CCMP3155]|eukprot:CEL97994.1 unnamed protein product [Vitrella brassicaformis CCMP3155]
MGNKLSAPEQQMLEQLEGDKLGQAHLLEPIKEDKKAVKKLLAELIKADKAYPGGLQNYIDRARKLLAESKAGVNPFEGYVPEIPEGEKLDVGSAEFADFEKLGMEQLEGACFVLVAGGLGERLGYPGIKIGLPAETTTGMTYAELYIKYILAFQAYATKKAGKPVKLPLAIMTSEDTHARTVELLKKHKNFGLPADQLTLMKQEKVPALMDNEAKIAPKEDDPSGIQTKPHGHGDVHTLLNSHGLPQKWVKEGRKWVVFFQDTNGLIFRSVPAVLGVSAKRDFAMNSVTVPRKPGEAVGGICKLKKDDGSSLTINVEYNQLDPLLKETGDKQGDTADPVTGNSKFPGNINVLVFKADRYAETLTETNGTVPEFVNPKYKDATKTAFKSPTRLECMMQEFPRLFKDTDKVGFTELPRWYCFSTVKNNVKDAAAKAKGGLPPEAPYTGEMDMYANAGQLLSIAGKAVGSEVVLGEPVEVTYLDIPYMMGPRIVLKPSFAVSIEDMKEKLKSGKINISAKSTLVLEGDIEIKDLDLDGALVIKVAPGAKAIVDGLKVSNPGWEFVPLEQPDSADTALQIRGYQLKKNDAKEYTINKGTETLSTP